jgi:hypothetical protein
MQLRIDIDVKVIILTSTVIWMNDVFRTRCSIKAEIGAYFKREIGRETFYPLPFSLCHALWYRATRSRSFRPRVSRRGMTFPVKYSKFDERIGNFLHFPEADNDYIMNLNFRLS